MLSRISLVLIAAVLSIPALADMGVSEGGEGKDVHFGKGSESHDGCCHAPEGRSLEELAEGRLFEGIVSSDKYRVPNAFETLEGLRNILGRDVYTDTLLEYCLQNEIKKENIVVTNFADFNFASSDSAFTHARSITGKLYGTATFTINKASKSESYLWIRFVANKVEYLDPQTGRFLSEGIECEINGDAPYGESLTYLVLRDKNGKILNHLTSDIKKALEKSRRRDVPAY